MSLLAFHDPSMFTGILSHHSGSDPWTTYYRMIVMMMIATGDYSIVTFSEVASAKCRDCK